jgi:hypothetical protein
LGLSDPDVTKRLADDRAQTAADIVAKDQAVGKRLEN